MILGQKKFIIEHITERLAKLPILDIKEKEIYHVVNEFGFYKCYQNGKDYRRITKTGFCINCGTLIKRKIK